MRMTQNNQLSRTTLAKTKSAAVRIIGTGSLFLTLSCVMPRVEPLVLEYLEHGKPLSHGQMSDLRRKENELIKKLHDKEWFVRFTAAKGLELAGSPKSVPFLLVAIRDANGPVRSQVVKALIAISERNPNNPEMTAAIPQVSKMFQQAADILEKNEMLDILAKIGKSAVPELSKILQHEKDLYYRHKIIDALIGIGKPSYSVLIEALEGADLFESANINAKLLRIGKPLIPYAVQALNDMNPEVFYLLVRLAKHDSKGPDSRIIGALSKALKCFNAKMQTGAALSFGEIKDARAVLPLIEALQDMDRDVRMEIINALGKIQDKRALPSLTELKKNDPDKYVRKAAEEAIMSINLKLE